MNTLLRGLEPKKKYKVQVRGVGEGDNKTEWSKTYNLETIENEFDCETALPMSLSKSMGGTSVLITNLVQDKYYNVQVRGIGEDESNRTEWSKTYKLKTVPSAYHCVPTEDPPPPQALGGIQVLATALAPDTRYKVQVRGIGLGGDKTEWSKTYDMRTMVGGACTCDNWFDPIILDLTDILSVYSYRVRDTITFGPNAVTYGWNEEWKTCVQNHLSYASDFNEIAWNGVGGHDAFSCPVINSKMFEEVAGEVYRVSSITNIPLVYYNVYHAGTAEALSSRSINSSLARYSDSMYAAARQILVDHGLNPFIYDIIWEEPMDYGNWSNPTILTDGTKIYFEKQPKYILTSLAKDYPDRFPVANNTEINATNFNINVSCGVTDYSFVDYNRPFDPVVGTWKPMVGNLYTMASDVGYLTIDVDYSWKDEYGSIISNEKFVSLSAKHPDPFNQDPIYDPGHGKGLLVGQTTAISATEADVVCRSSRWRIVKKS